MTLLGCLTKNNMQSIVKDAEIFFVKHYLTKQDADLMMSVVDDGSKFKKPTLYFYDATTNQVVQRKGWRESYWFGEYAQAAQSTSNTAINYATGETITVPTDFVEAYPFEPQVFDLKQRIENEFDVTFNSCLVGKFSAPDDKIGFHSDASHNMGDDPHVASISFGKSRRFVIKKARGEDERVEVLLEHGDLLLIRKDANRKYLHMVPADKACSQTNFRISLTFRNYNYDEVEIQHTLSRKQELQSR